jgi:sulfoxide reductase heme-binding subunit YedZ
VITTSRSRQRLNWLQVLIHILGWLPLVILLFNFFTNRLTINPIQELEQRLGRTAVYFLVATLAVTPTYAITGWRGILKQRRALGLYTFLYASLHVMAFIGLDYGFHLLQVYDLVIQKLYLLIGTLAMLLLIPLAATSFDYFFRKMGRNWKRLHWLIYPASLFVILHYALAQKGDIFFLRGNILKPFLWGIFVVILLLLRLPPVRKWFIAIRRRLGNFISTSFHARKVSSVQVNK